MRIASKALTLFAIAMIPLALSSCGATETARSAGATLPPNDVLYSDVLYSKIAEVGRAMDMPLVYENKKEGLFIWRFGKSGCEGRFAWHVKRAGNELALNDPAQLRGKCSLITERVPQIQEEFKRRFLALAGRIRLRGPGKDHSVKVLLDALSASF